MACKEIGQVEVKGEIEWRIADFLSVVKNKNFHYYKSPTFSIENEPYFFRLRPQNQLNPEYACLYLASDVGEECLAEYDFSLKKSDGSMEELTEVLVGDRSRCGNYISLPDVQQRKSKLAPRDVITIICKLNNHIIPSAKQTELDKIKSLKIINVDALSEDFKKLFLNGKNRDLTLRVADKEFRVHQDILMARSQVFQAMLTHDMTEKEKGVIDIPDCDPQAMEQFLFYIYSGKVETLNKENAQALYYVADKYDMTLLKEECTQYIKKSLNTSIIFEVIQLALHHCDGALLEYATAYFLDHTHEIFPTLEWMSFLKTNSVVANELLIKASEKWNSTK